MSEQILKISKWSDEFENASSRKLKALHWVAIPVSFTSNGYNLMLEEFGDDAPAIYGAWCALIKVAAQCNQRGVLSTASGKPMRIAHISRMTGFPEAIFHRLFEWASSDNVKWLVASTYDDTGRPLAESADAVADSAKHKTDLTGQDNTPPTPTGTGAGVGGGGVFWDGVGAKQAAERLRKRWSRLELPTELVMQVALAATALEPSFIATLLADCHGKKINSPRHYVLQAARNMAIRHGWDWDVLVSSMPTEKPVGALATSE